MVAWATCADNSDPELSPVGSVCCVAVHALPEMDTGESPGRGAYVPTSGPKGPMHMYIYIYKGHVNFDDPDVLETCGL